MHNNLIHLDLSENNLNEFSFGNLPSGLVFLNITKNNFKKLPPILSLLENLCFIYLSSNELITLDVQLYSVITFFADQNKLTTFEAKFLKKSSN